MTEKKKTSKEEIAEMIVLDAISKGNKVKEEIIRFAELRGLKSKETEKILDELLETKDVIENIWKPSKSDLTWVNDLLPQIKIGGEWITSFATYRKTGERELTLIAKIYSPSWNTDENISRVKKAVESIGWTYKEAENAPIIGVCIEKDKV